MSSYLILGHIATVVWLFPPIKQWRTKYFYFFLIYALAGPTLLLSAWLFRIQFNYLYPSVYFFLLSTFLNSNKRIIVLFLAFTTLFLFPVIKPNNVILFSLSTVLDFIVFIIILSTIIDQAVKKTTINLFLTLLFVYTSIDIVKLFDITVNINLGYVYYYFGVAAQILFGISFWFINEHTKTFKIKLKGLEELDS